jgi:hypothetical protein
MLAYVAKKAAIAVNAHWHQNLARFASASSVGCAMDMQPSILLDQGYLGCEVRGSDLMRPRPRRMSVFLNIRETDYAICDMGLERRTHVFTTFSWSGAFHIVVRTVHSSWLGSLDTASTLVLYKVLLSIPV